MKNLVVCCDGTWSTPDHVDRGRVSPTNVVKTALAVAARRSDGTLQLIHYHSGVGTGRFDHLRGGAFGFGLSANILEAYRFVARHFEPGDALFLFGFSRGAYTARSLAGLIRTCGILRRLSRERLDEAYALYRRRDDTSHPRGVEASLFRRMHSHETRIRCIGVWDTVGALGIPGGGFRWLNRRWTFHDVDLSSTVDNAFQALAIDEERSVFVPALWRRQPGTAGQRLEQVWFAGAHSNVGGGYADAGLSDLAFLWMKQRAEECGLEFDETAVRNATHPDLRGELRDSSVGVARFLPRRRRPIGAAPDGNESVHDSVLARIDSVGGYRPENVLAFLRRQGRAAA
jgi:uncharacterized protein (DUF2235 family)